MAISTLADTLVRSIERTGDRIFGVLTESVVRLGVTGLARSGKTVFITSLIANLRDRNRMTALTAKNRIAAAFLQPQPDDTVTRFSYEIHRDALYASQPRWPVNTSTISELRLSLRIRPASSLARLQGSRIVHLDIVDYPGEWLLDLALLNKSYSNWSAEALKRLDRRTAGQGYRVELEKLDAGAKLDEVQAASLSETFTEYLRMEREKGFHGCTPGRFLLPGDLAGSPVITFAPLRVGHGSLWKEFERRFEAYKAKVVKPFFRSHLARIDRQIVLVDALGAIGEGPEAVEDLRQAIAGILEVFRPGRNPFLSRIFLGRRVERLLFAATKADHLHQSQHARLTAIVRELTRDAGNRADFAGAETEALAIAAIRATTEETRPRQRADLDMVRGTLECGKQAAHYYGTLPEDPRALLHPARQGARSWPDMNYSGVSFAPTRLMLKSGDGPPHIRV